MRQRLLARPIWDLCLLGRCQDRQATGCLLEAGTTLAWQREKTRLQQQPRLSSVRKNCGRYLVGQ